MRSKDCFYASYYVILCMRLKYIFLFSGFFSCSCMLFGKEKANITLHLTNLPKDSSSSFHGGNNLLYGLCRFAGSSYKTRCG
jgi:hypothetical protein